MDIEKLIEDITKLVYEEIKANVYEKKNKKIFLAFESEETKQKYSLLISDWNGIDFINQGTDSIDEYDHIICPELANKDLIDISIGRASSQISSLLIEGLFKGKRITCIDEGLEYTKYKNQARESFYKLFENYKETLIDYGMEFVGLKDLGNILKLNEDGNKTKIISKEHKLITEAFIERLWKQGFDRIKLPESSIITSLSEDFARENNIKITRY